MLRHAHILWYGISKSIEQDSNHFENRIKLSPKAIFLFFVFMVSLTSGLLYAGDNNGVFIYGDIGIRDPFSPIVDNTGKLMVTQGNIDSVKDTVVEGILYDPGGESVIILNGLVLKESDQVGNIKVERIQEHSVVLSSKGKTYTLKPKE